MLSVDPGCWEEWAHLTLLLCGSLSSFLYSYTLFRAQDPPCCGMLGMDQSPDTERMSELLERSSSPDGKPQGTLSFSVWARCPLTLKRLALLLKGCLASAQSLATAGCLTSVPAEIGVTLRPEAFLAIAPGHGVWFPMPSPGQ